MLRHLLKSAIETCTLLMINAAVDNLRLYHRWAKI